MRNTPVLGLVAVLLVVATAPAVTTRLYASDEVMYYAFLRSLWFDRDVSFENEYRYMYDHGVARSDGFRETLLERTTPTGLRLNFGTMGSAVLWAPFYAVADAGTRVARAFGSPVPADGYSRPYIAAVCYGSAIYGWLALLFSALAASRILGLPPGRLRPYVPLLVCAATPLVFYMYVTPGFAHVPSAFAVSSLILAWLWARQRWSPGRTWVLGALGALVVMVREQDAFLLLGPCIDFAWFWLRGRRASDERREGPDARRTPSHGRLVASVCAAAGAFAIAYLPQVLVYLALNGRVGPPHLLTRKMDWWSPHAAGILVSPEHGLLWWTPLVVLAVAGLVLLLFKRERRVIGVCLLAMAVGHVYMTGCVASWTAAGTFGQRRFVALTPLFVIGLAALWSSVRGRAARVALGAVCALCVWWNVGLMVQFGAGLMDRQRLEIGRNARVTFLVLPFSIPRLAYTYLVNRQSFYHPPPAAH